MKLTSLRERLIIQTRAYRPDQMGGYTLSWADQGEIWAEMKPVNSDKEVSTYQVQWRAGISVPSTARLKWKNRYFQFKSQPQVDVQRRWVSVFVQEEEGAHE